jgi:hypothetical protein
MLIRKLLVLLAIVGLFAVGACAAQEGTGAEPAKSSEAPQVVVTAHMGTFGDSGGQAGETGLLVTEFKGKLISKAETKCIPFIDFDFAANLGDELTSALSEDKRARWRIASPEEDKQLASFYGPKAWKQKSFAPPSLQADRVLLVGTTCTALTATLLHVIQVNVSLRLADRQSGQILWKKAFLQETKLPGKLEQMLADNQKLLKETLNKLMEQIAPKMKDYVAKSRI